MARELLLCGSTVSQAADFQRAIDSPDYRVYYSYGDYVPALAPGFSFWGPGKYAFGLRELFPSFRPMAPGPRWLSDIPVELTGRELHTESYADALAALEGHPSVRFKLAELKHGAIPAARYGSSELRTILDANPELAAVQVQWTPAELPLDFEHRFFILAGEALTGSPYLVGGRVDHRSTKAWSRYAEALGWATELARELENSSPPAYTLDIGWNLETERWIIVEANRSWSSGIYGADPLIALESIGASTAQSDWDWVPDSALGDYAQSMEIELELEDAPGLIFLG